MKKKYAVIALLCIGIILLGLSFALTLQATLSTDIIGGADFPTFQFKFLSWNDGIYGTMALYGAASVMAACAVGVKNKGIKGAAVLASPPLLFPAIRIPYNWLNRTFIVKWLGCSCPKTDEFGNSYYPRFNANDFSCLFWFFAALGIGVLSFFLAKRIFIKRKWLIVPYVAAMLAWSLIVFRNYCLRMWWG